MACGKDSQCSSSWWGLCLSLSGVHQHKRQDCKQATVSPSQSSQWVLRQHLWIGLFTQHRHSLFQNSDRKSRSQRQEAHPFSKQPSLVLHSSVCWARSCQALGPTGWGGHLVDHDVCARPACVLQDGTRHSPGQGRAGMEPKLEQKGLHTTWYLRLQGKRREVLSQAS